MNVTLKTTYLARNICLRCYKFKTVDFGRHLTHINNQRWQGNISFAHQRLFSSSTTTETTSSSTTSSESLLRGNVKPQFGQSTNQNQTDEGKQSSSDSGKKGRWSNWTGRNAWKTSLVVIGMTVSGMGVALVSTWGVPERDQDGQIIKDEFTDKPWYIGYCLRAMSAAKDFFKMVRDPTSEKLLPDPLVHPYIQPPYTLVIELTDLLLKPQWDMKMGWRFKKRPGLDYFLQQCAQNGYEIVVFTLESASVGFPLTISMDPQNVIWYRLFKEDTRYTKGVHIKDLNCLNRDLSRVILLDTRKDTFQLNPRNGLALKKWNGDDNDRELYDLAALLKTIVTNDVKDVRAVIDYYNQFDDPMVKFRENQQAVLQRSEELARLQAEEKKKPALTKSPFIPADLKRR